MNVTLPGSSRSAVSVIESIRRAGGEAYLVGGCVRDLCLGKEPKDYDVATSLPPDDLIAIFPGANETGKSFGVVRVRRLGEEIEVATFRRDGPYTDGRRPDFVEYTDLTEDLARRDFTVNALALNVETTEVIDLVEGLSDLDAGQIRAVGEPRRRFDEDKLRLLRAVRFAHTLSFSIEEETWNALREMGFEISAVAMERVFEEFTKIITHPRAGAAIRLLDDSGILGAILPEIVSLKGVEQPAQFHPEGDVYIHTCMTMDELLPPSTPTVAWAALLHDIGKPATFFVSDRIRFHGHAELGARMARQIGRRFRFSNELSDRVHIIILEHQKFGDVGRMRPGRLKNWASQPHFEELLEVHRADCVASHGDMSAYETSCLVLSELRAVQKMPSRIVTGEMLIAMGMKPGPVFRDIIERAYESQLEGVFSDDASGRKHVEEVILPALFSTTGMEE